MIFEIFLLLFVCILVCYFISLWYLKTPAFVVLLTIFSVFISVFAMADGLEYRAGHNETLVNATRVRIDYIYTPFDWNFNFIIGLMGLMLSLLLGLGAAQVLKSPKTEEQESKEYYENGRY